MAFSLSRSLFSRMTAGSEESSFSHVLNRDLYKHREKIVDDECLRDVEPFPLLSGESLEYIGGSHGNQLVALTNYRLYATEETGAYSIPLGLIDTLELQVSKDCFNLFCKDGKVCRLCFSSVTRCRAVMEKILESRKRAHKDTNTLFAFVFGAYRKDERLPGRSKNRTEADTALLSLNNNSGSWREEVLTMEYRRMGLSLGDSPTRAWRISQANDKYEVCSTYPKLLLVPAVVSDEELATAAKFRMSGRLPVVSWRHRANGCVLARSSQPHVGVLGWRNPTDEKLLLAFSQACAVSGSNTQLHGNGEVQNGNGIVIEDSEERLSDSDEEAGFEAERAPRLIVFDLRSYTAALGNRAKGGGCECTDYYPNCEIFYKGLPNIHAIRKSFQQLRNVLHSEDQTNFLSNLEGTQWLYYLSQLVGVACEVVGVVNSDHSPNPLLVHCSDGWDRTTQVITLAEIMLDPYYRTIRGFRVLIEREWLGFGHQFSDRCGHLSEDTGSRSPIFLQWLDAVCQLLRQYPCQFEFNQHFLVKLGQHCFSCLYGTFLCNSVREREEERVAMDTYPVWSLLNRDNHEVVNWLYQSEDKVLYPATSVKHMQLWRAMYCRSLLTPYQTIASYDSVPPSPSPSDLLKCEQAQSSCSSFNTVDSHLDNSDSVNPQPPLSEETSQQEASLEEANNMSLDSNQQSLSNSNLTITQEQQNMESDETKAETVENSDNGINNPKSASENDSELTQSSMSQVASEETMKCGEFHENLHLSVSSLTAPAEEATSLANGHTQSKLLTPIKLQNGAANGKLLQEALNDVSPHIPKQTSIEQQCILLGDDGLPLLATGVQTRMRELILEPQREVRRLRARIRELEQLVNLSNTSDNTRERRDSIEDQLSSAMEDKSPTSLSSWDCVDHTEGNGVRWVPDHAVSHCQSCGAEFWAGLRKHHCRSCGGVFCMACSSYYCPVPHEQLFKDARVCEKCFYKLDGHLKTKEKIPPT